MRWWVAPACGLLALTSCGSRTGLLVTLGVEDAGPPIVDASPPPTDALMAEPIRYLVPSQAPEGVYTYALGQFDPPTAVFTDPVQLSCLAAVGDRPIALAPRCDGTVFVQFAGGSLWRVEAGTLNCSILEPPWPRIAVDASNADAPLALTSSFSPSGAEQLYFVAPRMLLSSQDSFGWVDPTTLIIGYLGTIPVRSSTVRLTADSAGQLFAFEPVVIEEIDETTGDFVSQSPVPMGTSSLQSVALWGGDFYFFNVTSTDATDVVRWTPNNFSTTPAGHTDRLVVAAGVSPCAPLH
jgi:hypothetical protein